MRSALLPILFLLLCGNVCAQFPRREAACDTTVFGARYTLVIKNFFGTVVAFGNRNKQGERHGPWCELNGNPEQRTEGEYLNGVRIGTWWMSKGEVWHYNDMGVIIAKGSGCRGCPPF